MAVVLVQHLPKGRHPHVLEFVTAGVFSFTENVTLKVTNSQSISHFTQTHILRFYNETA
jgi:hypothetical protein